MLITFDPRYSHVRRLYQDGYFVFTICHSITVCPYFHDVIRRWVTLDLEYVEQVKHVGKSSYSLLRKFYERISGKLLMETYSVWSVVDQVTRRPRPLPDWYKSSFSKDLPTSPPNPRIREPEMPGHHYSCQFVVVHSESDMNGHVNQREFVRHAMDCAQMASNEGFYTHVSGDLCRYDIKSQTSLYLGEARVGDTVLVHTWEDDSDVNVLHFWLCRPEGKLLVYLSISFYDVRPISRL